MTDYNVKTLTTDLGDFGMREIRMARDLLDAWVLNGLPDDFENDEVTVAFNRMSGYVFLTNAEFQVAVIDDRYLVSFYSSPWEGHEGTLAELVEMFDAETWNGEDIEWLEELCGERLV
tara:strand:- start:6218 stop:6571 length:354 start_codon:yes stop_codon:yes gene_type:complete